MVEFFSRDNVSLNDLPERPVVLGSYILPDMNFEEMSKLVSGATTTSEVTPRTVNAGSPLVHTSQPANTNNFTNNTSTGRVPF